MKSITKFLTFDGAEHSTQKDATKHLDRLYSDALLGVSRDISEFLSARHSKTSEYIDSNLDKFLQLQRIKDDMILQIVDSGEF